MSSVVIRKLFEQALNNINPPIETAFENAGYSPRNGVPYQSANVLLAQPENPTLSPGFHREVGIFQVSLRYPANQGTGLVQARAEILRVVFARGVTLTEGQISVRVSATPEIAPGRADGDRWVVPVKIRFFANVFE